MTGVSDAPDPTHTVEAMGAWSAVVGSPGSSKPDVCKKIAALLEERGLKVGGFVQLAVETERGDAVGWDVLRVDASERTALARRSTTPEMCEYAFEASGFSRAAEWAREPGLDVVVIGGIGKLEAGRIGHWPLLSELIERPDAPHVLASVRDSCLSAIALALPDPVAHVMLPCAESELIALADAITAYRR